MDEKNPLTAEQTGVMRDTVNTSPHKIMSPEKRAEYHEFVKSAWHEAVNHQKGAGQISQKDYALLHGKDGFVHAINAQRIKHIYDRHGNDAKESRLGQVAIKEADILNISDIIQTPSFIIRKIKHYGVYSSLYGKHTGSGETYIYIEQTSEKKRRNLAKTFYKINKIVFVEYMIKKLEHNKIYDVSEIEIENQARRGGYPSRDGGNKATSAAATSANHADTSLSITSPKKSSADSADSSNSPFTIFIDKKASITMRLKGCKGHFSFQYPFRTSFLPGCGYFSTAICSKCGNSLSLLLLKMMSLASKWRIAGADSP